MTFGTSVTIEQTWPRVLERLLTAELAERGDPRRVLVMNFAVQGYVYEQMARVYQDKIAPYRPDLLIVPTHPHDMLPMAQAADDAEYDLRGWVMRTAIHDWIHKRVVNKWIPGVPKSAETRRRIREHVELTEVDAGELRPGGVDHRGRDIEAVVVDPVHSAGPDVLEEMAGATPEVEQADRFGPSTNQVEHHAIPHVGVLL